MDLWYENWKDLKKNLNSRLKKMKRDYKKFPTSSKSTYIGAIESILIDIRLLEERL